MAEDMQKSHKALGKVLTILQEKGGCGKSSAIFNVSYYLSQNYKVLVIDLDGQAADITYYFFGNTIKDRDSILTILDCMRKTTVSVFDVIRPVTENLHLVPANISVTNIATTDKLATFRKIINELKEVYDYILIDVPPSPNWSHMLCLSVSKYIMPIVNPDIASPKALTSLCESISEAQEYTNPEADYLGIIMNMYDGRTNLARNMMIEVDNIATKLGTCMFRTNISQSVILKEHIACHQSVFEYAPKSKSAKEYEMLVCEILNRIKDLDEEESESCHV